MTDLGKPTRLAISYLIGIAVGWALGSHNPYQILVSATACILMLLLSMWNLMGEQMTQEINLASRLKASLRHQALIEDAKQTYEQDQAALQESSLGDDLR